MRIASNLAVSWLDGKFHVPVLIFQTCFRPEQTQEHTQEATRTPDLLNLSPDCALHLTLSGTPTATYHPASISTFPGYAVPDSPRAPSTQRHPTHIDISTRTQGKAREGGKEKEKVRKRMEKREEEVKERKKRKGKQEAGKERENQETRGKCWPRTHKHRPSSR